MMVYLCGGINGLSDADCRDWREVAKHRLRAETLDPMRRDYRGREDESVDEIVAGDLEDIRASDFVLVNATRPSWGLRVRGCRRGLGFTPSVSGRRWKMKEPLPLRGHLCDGLKAFQAAGGGCKPRFKANGIVVACDDYNSVALTHCPFCGEVFTEPAELDCGMNYCDCTLEQHDDRAEWDEDFRRAPEPKG